MELIYIEPGGEWKRLASHLAEDIDLGKRKLLDPRVYGGVLKETSSGNYYVMTETAYRKAQRDCFMFYYRNTSRILSLGANEIIRDRTIACNLIVLNYDLKTPETGSMFLRDASPYMAKLLYKAADYYISADEYEEGIIEYAQKFINKINLIKSDDIILSLDNPVLEIGNILSGKTPFILPKLDSIRRYDKQVAKQFLKKGKNQEEVCGYIAKYSLLPVCLANDFGFDSYVRKVVAEAIFDIKYPERIESGWAKEINEHISGAWLNKPDNDDILPMPCRIVGKTESRIQVLANDADAEFGLPYSRDDIYEVDQSWLLLLTNDAEDIKKLKEAGLSSCNWI